jgi:hypothetical protein
MKDTLIKLWSLIEKNRWTVICPFFGVILWLYASFGCIATASNPLNPEQQVTAVELSRIYEIEKQNRLSIDKKFEWAAEDIKEEQERFNQVQATILKLASGDVSDWGGLVQLLFTGGFVGLFADNIRKNGVIGGLKRNIS